MNIIEHQQRKVERSEMQHDTVSQSFVVIITTMLLLFSSRPHLKLSVDMDKE
jgi:hypothetical protein